MGTNVRARKSRRGTMKAIFATSCVGRARRAGDHPPFVALGAGAAGAWALPGSSRGQGRPVRVRRHAPRLDGAVRQAGAMPTYKELIRKGSTGHNGMLKGFPPNTGVGGTRSLRARTRPSTARRTTLPPPAATFASRTSFSAAGILQADTIATRPSGRARRSPRSTGSAARRRTSRARRSTSDFFSNRGVLVGAADAGAGRVRRRSA